MHSRLILLSISRPDVSKQLIEDQVFASLQRLITAQKHLMNGPKHSLFKSGQSKLVPLF